MKLFNENGHVSDDALKAVLDGTLDELHSLEVSEHLSFCDACLERYTALLTDDILLTPAKPIKPDVIQKIRLRTFRVFTNKYLTAAAAVALALTMWGTGVFTHLGQIPIAVAKTTQDRASTEQSQKENFFTRSGSLARSINGAIDGALNIISGRNAN